MHCTCARLPNTCDTSLLTFQIQNASSFSCPMPFFIISFLWLSSLAQRDSHTQVLSPGPSLMSHRCDQNSDWAPHRSYCTSLLFRGCKGLEFCDRVRPSPTKRSKSMTCSKSRGRGEQTQRDQNGPTAQETRKQRQSHTKEGGKALLQREAAPGVKLFPMLLVS